MLFIYLFIYNLGLAEWSVILEAAEENDDDNNPDSPVWATTAIATAIAATTK